MKPDPLGQALLEHWKTGKPQRIQVLSPDVEADVYSSEIFFTPLDAMPEVEQIALSLAFGKTVDIGAAAGRHSILIQDKVDLLSIDQSPGAVDVMQQRGLENAQCVDLWNLEGQFDTILLLMNGIGLAGTLKKVQDLLQHLKRLLRPNGQILFDSCDLRYIYSDPDSLLHLTEVKDYYGEVSFRFKYKGEKSDQFNWVYIDERTMLELASQAGFTMETVKRTSRHGQYLARLILD